MQLTDIGISFRLKLLAQHIEAFARSALRDGKGAFDERYFMGHHS